MKTGIFKPERYIKREMIFVESAAFLPSILYTMTNDSPLGPEPPPMPRRTPPSTSRSHSGSGRESAERRPTRGAQESQPPARDHRPAPPTPTHPPVQIIQPAARPPACIRYPCPASQHATRGRQRRKEGEGEERTGKRRAVAPHRPQFSR